jgi:hypothetical protein
MERRPVAARSFPPGLPEPNQYCGAGFDVVTTVLALEVLVETWRTFVESVDLAAPSTTTPGSARIDDR